VTRVRLSESVLVASAGAALGAALALALDSGAGPSGSGRSSAAIEADVGGSGEADVGGEDTVLETDGAASDAVVDGGTVLPWRHRQVMALASAADASTRATSTVGARAPRGRGTGSRSTAGEVSRWAGAPAGWEAVCGGLSAGAAGALAGACAGSGMVPASGAAMSARRRSVPPCAARWALARLASSIETTTRPLGPGRGCSCSGNGWGS